MSQSHEQLGPKVPIFGARKRAQQLLQENVRLQQEVAYLRYHLHDSGALTTVELEARAVRAQEAIESAEHRLSNYKEKLKRLQKNVINVRKDLYIQDMGLYDFEHPAEHSTQLAAQLADVRARVRQMVRDKQATVATSGFTFNNSEAKGRQFIRAMSTMMLSAYNAEAENCIKTVKAGGLETANKRLERVVERVARYGDLIDLRIAPEYHRLRLEELALAARHLQAVKAEKEAEREHRAELREQRKAEAELKRERERLRKEYDHYVKAAEALRVRGDEAGAAELEAKLADVRIAIDNVDYRVANIRAGYVYVVSNIGSFGDQVVKIGMTRRLEPLDRIRELGGASVPFRFDVHALFFADDAIEVEAMLHREFSDRRLNRVNMRREYFYCTPGEVLEKLKEHNVAVVEFNSHAEAEEFHLSRAMASAERDSAVQPAR